MQASHHRCTCAVPRHATLWSGSNPHACCVGGRSMLASQRAAPRRRAAAGQAFFCGLHRADGPRPRVLLAAPFCNGPRRGALKIGLRNHSRPLNGDRALRRSKLDGLASYPSKARSATPQMQAEKPRRAQQCGMGAKEQRCEVFRPGGSAILAIDLLCIKIAGHATDRSRLALV